LPVRPVRLMREVLHALSRMGHFDRIPGPRLVGTGLLPCRGSLRPQRPFAAALGIRSTTHRRWRSYPANPFAAGAACLRQDGLPGAGRLARPAPQSRHDPGPCLSSSRAMDAHRRKGPPSPASILTGPQKTNALRAKLRKPSRRTPLRSNGSRSQRLRGTRGDVALGKQILAASVLALLPTYFVASRPPFGTELRKLPAERRTLP